MLERLKTLASIVIIPSALLYMAGFLCIESYLARFGIVNFDIINARFIIAGLLVGIFVATSFVCSRIIFDIVGKILVEQNAIKILAHTFKAILLIVLTSAAMSGLINIGSSSASMVNPVDSISFGRFDFIFYLFDKVSFLDDDLKFVAVWIVRFIFLFGILFLTVGAAIPIIKTIRLKFISKKEKSTPLTIVSSEPKITQDSAKYTSAHLKISAFIISYSVVLSLLVWSYRKLHEAAFDFNSFNDNLDLSVKYVFCWLLVSSLFIYGAINIIGKKPDKFSFDIFGNWNSNLYLPAMLQQIAGPAILSIFIFGNTIYPRIPVAIGGGQPREVQIKSRMSPDPFLGRKLFLIGESDQFLFLVDPKKNNPTAFEVSKSRIEFLITMEMRSGSQPEILSGD